MAMQTFPVVPVIAGWKSETSGLTLGRADAASPKDYECSDPESATSLALQDLSLTGGLSFMSGTTRMPRSRMCRRLR